MTDGNENHESGQEPERSTNVELPEADRTRSFVFLDQEGGDEKAAQGEEYIDAEEASGQQPGMSAHDGQNGHAAKTVKGGSIAEYEAARIPFR